MILISVQKYIKNSMDNSNDNNNINDSIFNVNNISLGIHNEIPVNLGNFFVLVLE